MVTLVSLKGKKKPENSDTHIVVTEITRLPEPPVFSLEVVVRGASQTPSTSFARLADAMEEVTKDASEHGITHVYFKAVHFDKISDEEIRGWYGPDAVRS